MIIVNNNFYVTCDVLLTDFTIILILFCLSTFTHCFTCYLWTYHMLPFSHLFSSLLFSLKQKPRYPCAKIFEPTFHPFLPPDNFQLQCNCFVNIFGAFISVATHPFFVDRQLILILVFYKCDYNRGLKTLFLG